MSEILLVVAVVGLWILLQVFVLPKLGVST
jgi:hypothetical protein